MERLDAKAALTSQRFWDHMDKIKGDTALSIWKNIFKGVAERERKKSELKN
jgi:hypothetical protein